MKKTLVTGLLLLAFASWADTLVSAWETANASSQPAAATAKPVNHQHNAGKKGHECCPSLHARVLAEMGLPQAPCGDQHRCCFSQGRDLPANLPATTEGSRLGSAVAFLDVDVPATHSGRSMPALSVIAPQPYSALSMVLRN